MKLLIVDDHSMVRAGLAALLEQPHFDAQVLLAQNAKEGIAIAQANPDLDVVLLDIVLPDMDGIAAIGEFGKSRPDLPVILLAASEDPADVRRGLAAGAMGYVPKSSRPDTLISAIRFVLSGQIYVPPVMLRGEADTAPLSGISARSSIPLTERQVEVLRLLDRGLSNKEIGRELGVSERTVKAHMTAIFKSLGVTGRAEAIERARRTALI
jgi:two-component system, NarL family, nitrate/nitrite response regulator NarL